VTDSYGVDESRPLASQSHAGVSSGGHRVEHVAGDLLGSKYRLIRHLGRGGMGTVWLATNETLGSDVAIKVIRRDLNESVLTLRLMAEARAIARLGHPNIVRVFDVGQTDQGQPFIVMELLRGQSLGFKIRRGGRMPAEVAVQTLLPIAHALAITHEAGIVHRDLKPDNVVLEEREDLGVRPVLVDFGVAKSSSTGGAKLTLDGATVGSPEYMSPEQARGDTVDARADMWAFCIMLYEALLGHVPFTDTNYHRLLRRIIDEPIPAFSRAGIQDDALWAIIEQGLRKNPDERFANMRVLGVGLARWLLNLGITEDASHAALRATWLQSASTEGRRNLASAPDSVETLQAPPQAPPRPSLVRAFRRKYLATRLGWFTTIFVVSMLMTLVLKPWLQKQMSAQVPSNSGHVVSEHAVSAPPKEAVVPASAAGANGPTRNTSAPGDSAMNAPLSQAPAPNASALGSGVTSLPQPPATHRLAEPVRRAAAGRRGNPVKSGTTAPPAPAKLDIKTDF